MAIFPSSIEAEKEPLFKNRIFPKNKALKENRPSHRTHPYGGTLVWGVFHKPTIINPILTTHSVSMTLLDLIFNRLVRINNKGEIEPDFAKKWEISEDGLIYTFYLKEGIRFHDGVECTADDVYFTYEQIVDLTNNSPFRSHFELVERFEIVDKYSFRIVLKKSFPALLYKLVREIVPKHVLEGKNLNETAFNYHPIGTGPFKFKSWDQKINQIDLEASPYYFEGRPYLDKIIVKTYSDASQVWAAFMRHEVDLVQWITSKDYSVLENDPAFRAYAIPGSMYYAIVYNLNDFIWNDQQVRQAIAHGINKKEIIGLLPGLSGIESTGPFHPASIGYNHEVDPFEFNPTKAKMMLMHRGWLDMNQDAYGSEHSIRKKDGRKLELRMLVDEKNDTYKKITKIIRQQLSEIGVKVVVLSYRDESELTEAYLKKNKPQAWLRLFSGLGFGGYDAMGSWYSLSSQSGKLWNYKNEEVDQLFELGRAVQDDLGRGDIYKDIHTIVYNDQPACFLFFPSGHFAINAKFRNTKEYFNVHMPTYTIKDWYLEKNSEN